MDKLDKLLDAVEHPEKYSGDELTEIASDPETRDLYRTMCACRSSAFTDDKASGADIDHEWEKFRNTHILSKRGFIHRMTGSRAAAAVTIIMFSFTALAVGISIGLSRQSDKTTDTKTEISVAALSGNRTSLAKEISVTAESAETPDSIGLSDEPVAFRDEKLETVLSSVATHHGLRLSFRSAELKSLRIHFTWDQSEPIDRIIDRLNTFHCIHMSLHGDTLTVD